MSKIYLDWNLGLGDAIICNSLVRELCKVNEKIVIPCHSHNFKSVNAMFSDLSNLEIVSDLENKPQGYEIMSVGSNNPKFGSWHSFDRAFYELAGIIFETRWTSFDYPNRGLVHDYPKESYILKHEDLKRGFVIQDRHLNHTYPILNFEGKESIIEYVPLIENAMTIHCIDSAFMHLVDSVNPKAELFYHKYARNSGPFHQTEKKHKWNVLA